MKKNCKLRGNNKEEKSDVELVADILRKAGWGLRSTIDGFEIGDETYTVGCVIEVAPDEPEGTDFFAFSSDESTDGHICTFTSGYPEEYEIIQAVKAAFEDERKYRTRKGITR